MGINYLNNKSWTEITREERLFCSHLYHSLLPPQNRKKFITELNQIESPVDGFKNKINLSLDNHWEVGFEVCFYRDLIFDIGRKSDTLSSSLRKINSDREKGGNGKCSFSEKRTFDLCLFSNDELVIIEAKVYQGLSHEQNKEFKKDQNQIKELFELLRDNGQNYEMPAVKLIILASSNYLGWKSFSSKRGIGRKFIETNANGNYLCGFISWKQIAKHIFDDKIFETADEVYNRKARS